MCRMEITPDELLEGFQELATENAILRRRLAIKDRQVKELSDALNQRTLDQTPVGGGVLVDQSTGLMHPAPDDPRELGRLADAVEADGEPDGEAALKGAYKITDQVLKMHALSPDMAVRGKALAELLGREPTAAELDDPETTLVGLYEGAQG
jgi:hypothetical protein